VSAVSSAPLIVTQGDPAGIGPEITLKAWLKRREARLMPFILASDPDFIARTAQQLHLDVPVQVAAPEDAAAVFDQALPILPIDQPVHAVFGKPDPHSSTSTLRSIDMAVGLTLAGWTKAVVTNPIAKHVLYQAGFRHPGHTEYLAFLCVEHEKSPPLHPVMLLWSETLAVVPVTVHIPLRDVPAALTTELILTTARIVAKDLRDKFRLTRPRLAIAGLNPHAGEKGTMGTEDADIIAPAIAALQHEAFAVSGPHSADTLFHERARAHYDVALAMYHDQALIPIKTLSFDKAVNVTLGLPLVRTSPDHGTAFNIAGQGIARADSLIAALTLAQKLTS
jgi:4-hydroxythreonine-4-phosphate dehydrogenase